MRRAGLTLVELVLALGLLSVLMLFVFQLLDGSLRLFDSTETRRELSQRASGVLELLVDDLSALEPGPDGDLLVEWVLFDVDADGVGERLLPRLRMVRRAGRAAWSRLIARDPAALEELGELPGRIEVCWTLEPARPGDARTELRAGCVLSRGERPRGAPGLSFFDDAFFARRPGAPAGELAEVAGGVLWLGLELASQTTVARDGWTVGPGLADGGASWDAWGRRRPDAERHAWNEPAAGTPEAPADGGFALLPRRVRITLELEGERERKRRPRLARELDEKETGLVTDGRPLPPPGAFVLVGAEWMELTSTSDGRAAVRRGARGSEPARHEPGAMIHFGEALVRELPIDLHREDWDL